MTELYQTMKTISFCGPQFKNKLSGLWRFEITSKLSSRALSFGTDEKHPAGRDVLSGAPGGCSNLGLVHCSHGSVPSPLSCCHLSSPALLVRLDRQLLVCCCVPCQFLVIKIPKPSKERCFRMLKLIRKTIYEG